MTLEEGLHQGTEQWHLSSRAQGRIRARDSPLRRGIAVADSFDLVVIGGGSGGYVAAIRAAQYGLSVGLVERARLGGTCLHSGCIPTKVFLESAGLLDRMRRSEELGISAGAVKLDFGAVAVRREKIVSANEQGVRGHLKSNRVEEIAGDAALAGPNEVLVTAKGGQRRLKARNVLLSTGSRPKSLPGLEIDGERVVSSDHVTAWTDLPKSLLVAGAGAVGAELASAMADFGVEVTLIEFLPRVLPLEDAEVSPIVARSFGRRGIKVLTGARILPETLKRERRSVSVEVEVGKERQRLGAERLLVAIGREPVTDGLALEKTGVKIDQRGFVEVDPYMRTGEPSVYACGDVVGGLMLAHVAYQEGKVAAATMAGRPVAPIDYDAMPRATYTRPEVASVGLTEEQAREKGRDVKVGRFRFGANPKAMIQGEAEGLVKIVTDGATGEILGAHMVGPHVTELIAEPIVAKLLESTALEIALAVHPHPTLSEALNEAAADVDGLAIHVPHRRPS
jgi:dihydrolipoamide dehydrogenase